jgi:REP element-mobilizing transposase RayT
MQDYTPKFESDKFFHVYNHAVGQDNLFETNENYNFFLNKYSKYINPIADTFVYCLMPNHFHFLVMIKEQKEIEKIMRSMQKLENSDATDLENMSELISKFVSKQFSNLFNSYSKSFNKQQNRTGNLFNRPLKRKHVNDDIYLKNLIHYIHYNPVYHEFVENLNEWKHSSYESFFSEKKTNLKRKEVIEIFNDIENFHAFHLREIDDEFSIDFE